jgi:hypothetical protein
LDIEQHLKQLIGDLVFNIAKLQADADASKDTPPPVASTPATGASSSTSDREK